MVLKRITILGSTGSIGKSALDVVSANRERFRIVGLTAKGSVDVLLGQIKEFEPEVVAVYEREAAKELRKRTRVPVLEGEEGVAQVAAHERADFVLSAIVGFAGLIPTLAAVRAGKTIGLANKESLVVAGELVMREAERLKVRILPVDSEHSAVFQCMEGKDFIKRIILTASGGPFLGKTKKELSAVKPEDALRHPNWSMGKKITIDSATLMNKGFEVIEAHHLFRLDAGRIDVLVHPESIVHSIVEFVDGSSVAHLSAPDMKAPIAYALSYPERLAGVIPPLDLTKVGSLTFKSPNNDIFPCLSYAYEALKAGGTMPAVLNASNEAAVEAFLSEKIGFTDIPAIIKATLDSYNDSYGRAKISDIEAVKEADKWARRRAAEAISRILR